MNTIKLTLAELVALRSIYTIEPSPRYFKFLISDLDSAIFHLSDSLEDWVDRNAVTIDFDLGDLNNLEIEHWAGELHIYEYKHQAPILDSISKKLHDAAWEWLSDYNDRLLVWQQMYI